MDEFVSSWSSQMNEEYIELGKRAVACSGWRWMPGMLHGMVAGGKLTSCYRIGDLTLYLDADRVPDFTDPATLGCLLYLVRESCGMPTGIIVRYSNDNGRWEVSWPGSTHGGICGFGATEAEALVMALESVQ
jgi:hypothetical protein